MDMKIEDVLAYGIVSILTVIVIIVGIASI